MSTGKVARRFLLNGASVRVCVTPSTARHLSVGSEGSSAVNRDNSAPRGKKAYQARVAQLASGRSAVPPTVLPPQSSTGAAADEWLHSEERTANITRNERWIVGIALVSGSLAMAMFTATKWEVERRLQELPPEEEQAWRDGTYKPQKKVDG